MDFFFMGATWRARRCQPASIIAVVVLQSCSGIAYPSERLMKDCWSIMMHLTIPIIATFTPKKHPAYASLIIIDHVEYADLRLVARRFKMDQKKHFPSILCPECHSLTGLVPLSGDAKSCRGSGHFCGSGRASAGIHCQHGPVADPTPDRSWKDHFHLRQSGALSSSKASWMD